MPPTPTATSRAARLEPDAGLSAIAPRWRSSEARRAAYPCAAYHQNPWLLFHPAWRKHLPDDAALLENIVDDPDGKLEADFRVPDYLRSRVLFWMRVHSSFTREMRLIHDRQDLSLIYGYIDYQPLYGACGPGARTRKLERAITRALKERLRQAAGLEKGRALTSGDQALREMLSRHGALSVEGVHDLSRGIRTQTGQRDEFLAALQRSRDLLPQCEAIFRRHGLPAALARIPFVESSFNWHAHSRVGAIGIWQLMPRTAHQLFRHFQRAQWADPLLQSEGASKLLADFRRHFPDWSLTVTAYNSGLGRLRRLARRYQAHNLQPLLAASGRLALGFAGRNFFAQLLSANLVEAYQDRLFQVPPPDPLVGVPPPDSRLPAGE